MHDTVIADMTRQYKTMQSGLESRIAYLEAQVRRQQTELGITKPALSVDHHYNNYQSLIIIAANLVQ